MTDTKALESLEILHTFAVRGRTEMDLVERHNREMDEHMRTIADALSSDQEPVAYLIRRRSGSEIIVGKMAAEDFVANGDQAEPLFTRPPSTDTVTVSRETLAVLEPFAKKDR